MADSVQELIKSMQEDLQQARLDSERDRIEFLRRASQRRTKLVERARKRGREEAKAVAAETPEGGGGPLPFKIPGARSLEDNQDAGRNLQDVTGALIQGGAQGGAGVQQLAQDAQGAVQPFIGTSQQTLREGPREFGIGVTLPSSERTTTETVRPNVVTAGEALRAEVSQQQFQRELTESTRRFNIQEARLRARQAIDTAMSLRKEGADPELASQVAQAIASGDDEEAARLLKDAPEGLSAQLRRSQIKASQARSALLYGEARKTRLEVQLLEQKINSIPLDVLAGAPAIGVGGAGSGGGSGAVLGTVPQLRNDTAALFDEDGNVKPDQAANLPSVQQGWLRNRWVMIAGHKPTLAGVVPLPGGTNASMLPVGVAIENWLVATEQVPASQEDVRKATEFLTESGLVKEGPNGLEPTKNNRQIAVWVDNLARRTVQAQGDGIQLNTEPRVDPEKVLRPGQEGATESEVDRAAAVLEESGSVPPSLLHGAGRNAAMLERVVVDRLQGAASPIVDLLEMSPRERRIFARRVTKRLMERSRFVARSLTDAVGGAAEQFREGLREGRQ